MKIRLTGTPAELIRAVDTLRATEMKIESSSAPLRRRGGVVYNVYLDVQLPPAASVSPATVAAALRSQQSVTAEGTETR